MKRQEKKEGHKECLKRDRYHFKLLKALDEETGKEGGTSGARGPGTNSRDRYQFKRQEKDGGRQMGLKRDRYHLKLLET
jgi:hypothetical protein